MIFMVKLILDYISWIERLSWRFAIEIVEDELEVCMVFAVTIPFDS